MSGPLQPSRVAFVDESYRRLEDGQYGALLGAVVIAEADEALVTSLVRGQLAPGQLRFHWRDESDPTRRAFVEAIASRSEVNLSVVVVATKVAHAGRIEYGRVQTLWRLLAELGAQGVGRLVIESRLERNDRKDRREIERAMQAGICSEGLVYGHLRPTEGPPLWVADAVAGSASAHLFDHDSRTWEILARAGRHVDVRLVWHPGRRQAP